MKLLSKVFKEAIPGSAQAPIKPGDLGQETRDKLIKQFNAPVQRGGLQPQMNMPAGQPGKLGQPGQATSGQSLDPRATESVRKWAQANTQAINGGQVQAMAKQPGGTEKLYKQITGQELNKDQSDSFLKMLYPPVR